MALSWLNLPCALMAAIIRKKRTLAISPRPRHAAAWDARESGLCNPRSKPPGVLLGGLVPRLESASRAGNQFLHIRDVQP